MSDDSERLKRLLEDDELWRPYWDRQHSHFWTLAVTKLTSAVGRWVLVVVATSAGGAVLVYAAKNGWFGS